MSILIFASKLVKLREDWFVQKLFCHSYLGRNLNFQTFLRNFVFFFQDSLRVHTCISFSCILGNPTALVYNGGLKLTYFNVPLHLYSNAASKFFCRVLCRILFSQNGSWSLILSSKMLQYIVANDYSFVNNQIDGLRHWAEVISKLTQCL